MSYPQILLENWKLTKSRGRIFFSFRRYNRDSIFKEEAYIWKIFHHFKKGGNTCDLLYTFSTASPFLKGLLLDGWISSSGDFFCLVLVGAVWEVGSGGRVAGDWVGSEGAIDLYSAGSKKHFDRAATLGGESIHLKYRRLFRLCSDDASQ